MFTAAKALPKITADELWVRIVRAVAPLRGYAEIVAEGNRDRKDDLAGELANESVIASRECLELYNHFDFAGEVELENKLMDVRCSIISLNAVAHALSRDLETLPRSERALTLTRKEYPEGLLAAAYAIHDVCELTTGEAWRTEAAATVAELEDGIVEPVPGTLCPSCGEPIAPDWAVPVTKA